MGGSISAEHGIGRLKRDELASRKSAVEMGLMRGIKQTLDPNGILAPGKQGIWPQAYRTEGTQ